MSCPAPSSTSSVDASSNGVATTLPATVPPTVTENYKIDSAVAEFLVEFKLKPEDLIPSSDDGKAIVMVSAEKLYSTVLKDLPRRQNIGRGTLFKSLRYTLKSGRFLEVELESAKTNPHGCLCFTVYNADGKVVDQGDFAHLNDWSPRMKRNDGATSFKTVQYALHHVMGDFSMDDTLDDTFDSVDDAIKPFDPSDLLRVRVSDALAQIDALLAGPLPGDPGYDGDGKECTIQ